MNGIPPRLSDGMVTVVALAWNITKAEAEKWLRECVRLSAYPKTPQRRLLAAVGAGLRHAGRKRVNAPFEHYSTRFIFFSMALSKSPMKVHQLRSGLPSYCRPLPAPGRFCIQ